MDVATGVTGDNGPVTSDYSRPVRYPPPAAAPAPPRQRTRLPTRTRLDFVLDGAIFAAFLVAEAFGFTGIAIHEWLGLALGLVLLVHLTLHWDWVLRTTRRMFTRRGRDRVIWLVNLALLASMTLCIMSGILISQVALPALGIRVSGGGFWGGLHGTTATITLILIAAHVGLRWRWVASVGRRLLARSPDRRPR